MVFEFIKNSRSCTVLNFLAEFFKNTSVHGFSHLASANIHWLEFFFWLLTTLAMAVAAIHISIDLILQYQRENVVISIDTNFMVWNSTTPSYTFCPLKILNESKVAEYIRQRPLPSEISEKDLKHFINEISLMTISNINALKDINYGISPNNYMQLIFNLSMEYIITSRQMTTFKIVSDLGICYTANNVLIKDGVSSIHWGDYIENAKAKTLKAITEPNNYNSFTEFPQEHVFGHNLRSNYFYIHSPYEIPTTWSRTVTGSDPDQILPLVTRTEEVTYENNLIRDAKIEQRQCRTNKESNLEMFPNTYSRNLCLMECRARRAYHYCHCIPHFYGRLDFPRKLGMPICNVPGLNCLSKYTEILRSMYSSKDGVLNCSCHSNCNDLLVTAQKANRRRLQTIIVLFIYDNLRKRIQPLQSKRIQYGRVPDISMTSSEIQKTPMEQYRRSIIFTNIDFAVSIGSVLGVFLGCSLLSLVDLVYFFSIRVFWFIRGYHGSVEASVN